MTFSLGISSIVVLTKFDTYVKSFPYENPSLKAPEVQNAIQRAANFFNLAPNRVFPLVNYYHEDAKSFEIDRIIYRIVETARNIADTLILTETLRYLLTKIHSTIGTKRKNIQKKGTRKKWSILRKRFAKFGRKEQRCSEGNAT